MHFKHKFIKSLLLCMTALIGNAYAVNGYLSREVVVQMSADFNQILLKRTQQPKTVSAFIKKYNFACKPKTFDQQGILRSTPLTCHVYDESDVSPSPWPLLILGIEKREIMAISGDQVGDQIKLPKNWRCDSVAGRASICVNQRSKKIQRNQWIKRLDSLFKTAN